jgi:hypothetical protein
MLGMRVFVLRGELKGSVVIGAVVVTYLKYIEIKLAV